ncbi:hypothetical protein QUC26_09290 [Pseudomonas asiatica]|uniref:hypothetical protein n=1 Tax=Pseudomonas asiatica TaxID=2219225 RepID=UPI0025A095FA|nr:hypothetical protein [Pseudomonas asiatica]WJM55322.1 hypothetical protein QUC26_09290 [Pseudomonas asiatica]
MMTTKVETKLDMRGLANLAKRMATLAKTRTEVGFFEGDTYDDGMPVAQVAMYNEVGTSFHPERPFMQETLKHQLKAIIAVLTQAARASILNTGNARSIMLTLGKMVADEIKVTIANYPGHNSPSTIARKGFDRPLYDTGKMLESVKFRMGGSRV